MTRSVASMIAASLAGFLWGCGSGGGYRLEFVPPADLAQTSDLAPCQSRWADCTSPAPQPATNEIPGTCQIGPIEFAKPSDWHLAAVANSSMRDGCGNRLNANRTSSRQIDQNTVELVYFAKLGASCEETVLHCNVSSADFPNPNF